MGAKRKQLHWSLVPKPQYPSLHPAMLSPAGMTKVIRIKPLQGDLAEDYYAIYFDRNYIPAFIQYKIIRPLKIEDREVLTFLAEKIENMELETN